MDSKVVLLVLLLIGTCLGTTYVQPQFPRSKEVPHNCLARGPYGGQYKCYVIIDYYSERFECYSLNVPYNFFERFENGDFVHDPMPELMMVGEPIQEPTQEPSQEKSAGDH
ncbi:hypothetical protein QR680_006144 [Steinernema hermaphroditum]|uniref:Secreted protein n=1 Tax=Steinernema hermaphroditum TaxID=289476 RepID=A0AA39HVU2_9BILA|nr:hypothetical protein QR680_006144 [Steinernema hermaphroditum]